MLTKVSPYARLIFAYDEGKDIEKILVVKNQTAEVWWQNRQTFSFAFRTLKTE